MTTTPVRTKCGVEVHGGERCTSLRDHAGPHFCKCGYAWPSRWGKPATEAKE